MKNQNGPSIEQRIGRHRQKPQAEGPSVTTYLVIWKDEHGIPRVWGCSLNENEAEVEAAKSLTEYKRTRPDLIGPWTTETKRIDE